MKQYNISENECSHIIECEGTPIVKVKKAAGATDTFTPIECGVWHWTRVTDTPVSEMRMELDTCFSPEYTMIPALNYNGNGWGDSV